MSDSLQIAQGEDKVPHESNPLSAEDDVKAAMDEAIKAAEEKSDEEQQEEVVEEVEEAAPPAEETPGDLAPPAAWTAEQQDVFRNATKEIQEFLLDFEQSRLSPLQGQLEALQPWQQVNQQWDPYFQNTGIPAAQLVNGLLQADMTLRTGTQQQKADLLNNIVRQYGISLGEEGLPEDLANDPVASAIHPEIQALKQGLVSLQSQMGNQFAALQQSQADQAKAVVDNMATAVDAEGKLKYPHFREVQPFMEKLAEIASSTGKQVTWDSVYEQACRAHPDVWPKIQSADRARAVAERKAVAADKQRASSSVSGSPAGSRTVKENPNESVFETVQRAMAQHSGGEGA